MSSSCKWQTCPGPPAVGAPQASGHKSSRLAYLDVVVIRMRVSLLIECASRSGRMPLLHVQITCLWESRPGPSPGRARRNTSGGRVTVQAGKVCDWSGVLS